MRDSLPHCTNEWACCSAGNEKCCERVARELRCHVTEITRLSASAAHDGDLTLVTARQQAFVGSEDATRFHSTGWRRFRTPKSKASQ